MSNPNPPVILPMGDVFRPYEYEMKKNELTGEMEQHIKQRDDTLTGQEKQMINLAGKSPDVAATLMAENMALKAELANKKK